jgi:hypothetical protein
MFDIMGDKHVLPGIVDLGWSYESALLLWQLIDVECDMLNIVL